MKVKTDLGTHHYRTVWWNEGNVEMIDQIVLPFEFRIVDFKNHKETANAITDMYIRGAGALGAAAGYAMAQGVYHAPQTSIKDFEEHINNAARYIRNARPTAQNLFYAVDKVLDSIKGCETYKQSIDAAVEAAEAVADEDAESCKQIGINGADLIPDGARILTHCNAGWLAFVDYGSALSPIYEAKNQGKEVFVYADETRPRLQGAKLTAWELGNEGVPHKIIADNEAGWLMQNGMIDLVIVGTDRTAANGDVANKIGTYTKAVLAKENNIPFYVALPTSTIALNTPTGKDIPIEERDQDEVLYIEGYCDRTKEVESVRIAAKGSSAVNYAFDVTPRKYVTALITEKGVIKPTKTNIAKLFKK